MATQLPDALDQRRTQLAALHAGLHTAGIHSALVDGYRLNILSERGGDTLLTVLCAPRIADNGHLWHMAGDHPLGDAWDIPTAVTEVKRILAKALG